MLTKVIPNAAGVAAADKLSTDKRDDGGTLVTYSGPPARPLPGQHSVWRYLRQGISQFGAEWYAIIPPGGVATRRRRQLVSIVRQPDSARSAGVGSGASIVQRGVRYLGALVLIGVALVHLYQYLHGH
jgi:hypothetical protein